MAYVPLTNHDQLSEDPTNGEACPGTKQVWLQWSLEQVLGPPRELPVQCPAGPSSHLTRALTVDRTTLDSRNSGVTRMWKREREAKATEGEKSASLKKLTWPTKVCGQRHM